MSDRILINDLRVHTVLGVHERERRAPRHVTLDLELEVDVARAAAEDDLAYTVDYHDVTEIVVEHVHQARCKLVETLAESVAALVLQRFPLVDAITITAHKPGALRHASNVAVRLRRARA